MQNLERFILKDGIQISIQEWIPDETRGTVVMVHGLGDHLCRYEHVAQRLNQAGFAVFRFDLPGHGHSGGTRGHIASYDIVMDLITTLLDEAREKFSGLPQFLYGHSLGGSLVLNYGITQKPVNLTGMISSSPGLGAAGSVPAWKLAFGQVLYNLAPSTTMENGLDLSGLSRDPSILKAYIADPLVHGKVSARLGLDIINKGRWIIEHAGEFPSIPLLLMQGSADRLVDPKATDSFALKCSARLTYKIWEGFYHELHNEPEKEAILQYIIDWMNRQI
jgi:acylglycerol lipase